MCECEEAIWFERQCAYTWVGVMWLISSAASCFSRVVLPALSRPNNSKCTSCSGDCFSLRRMDNRPYRWVRVRVRGDEPQQQVPRLHKETCKRFLTVLPWLYQVKAWIKQLAVCTSHLRSAWWKCLAEEQNGAFIDGLTLTLESSLALGFSG